MKPNTLKTGLLALALAGAVSVALAQGPGPDSPGYGPGMMGGYGPGMMGGYGPGYGRGGRGFGSGGGLAALDLNAEQREKIAAVQEENRKANWGTMGQMRSEQFKLRQMYNADKVDSAAVADQQKKVDELRRQMLKSHVDARNQVNAILTPEQRKQFRQYGPGWMHGEDEGGE
ncbi:MAG TPA: Spy/CpxP family protein refolding chaperone [Burkholderiales bacterium]|nr:Spy/CpxP family protein refolding chaperone [Burkholderiales bacterium]